MTWIPVLAHYLLFACIPAALIGTLWLVRRAVRREREW